MKSVELFAGAGGLAMGVALAGFKSEAVVEWDKWACDTIRENQLRHCPLVADWPLHEQDVRAFNFSQFEGKIDLIAGGPPCQPFSLGGKHRANFDHRDMFPSMIEVIRQVKPKAFLIENVKGLTRESLANYFQYITLQLTFPELSRQSHETWVEHLRRLEREKTSGQNHWFDYDIIYRVLNTADYGIPQRRERVFIVGFRHDLGLRWAFPETTHSLDALLHEQWITGRYWERHSVSAPNKGLPPERFKLRVGQLKKVQDLSSLGKPWSTVRDAMQGLPDPRDETLAKRYWNHVYQSGARAYPGHTGSPLDLPAKTLKAGDHGVPGGENMLVMPNGQVRYFTVRESARLQTFPDSYVFHGSWTETMRQLGNAVPVALARILSSALAEELLKFEYKNLLAALKEAPWTTSHITH